MQPVCPVCRATGRGSVPLRIAEVAREAGGHILEGVLHCSRPDCQREYPILDGIPLIIANLRAYVSDNVLALYGRRDLSATLESLLGDCCGPGSAFDQTRQHLSSYAWEHYADLDPGEPVGEPRPGTMLGTLQAGWELAAALPPGPLLEIGCSVGRGTFALAERSEALVLGVDLNFAMLRMAGEILRQGIVRYPRRRVGLVYDRREFSAAFSHGEKVDFWACDALALPFTAGTFSLAVSLNVLDCVAGPAEFLAQLESVLSVGGKAVLTCPYDWSPGATPLETWLGGHSQRSSSAGASEPVLRGLLTPGASPSSVPGLQFLGERRELPWHVRLHDRSTMTYQVHLVVAERTQG